MTTNTKQSIALSSIFVSAAMTVGKLVVGVLTGSLGVLAEGVNSLVDVGATVMTYLAVRLSDKPPDSEHHYGHGKIESVSALVQTGLLFVTAGWIVYHAVQRLFFAEEVRVETTWWAVAVIAVCIVVDGFRARALRRVARATHSQALEADALHFTSDMVSSAVVLAGLGLVWLGYPKGDALAAIAVAVFVFVAGWGLGRRTIDTLMDAAPKGATARVEAAVAGVSGVAQVDRIRVRPGGSGHFVDVDVSVSRMLPLDQVSGIRQRIGEAVLGELPGADVSATTQPLALDDETIRERVGIIAANQRLAVHHVMVANMAGKLAVTLDLEVDAEQSLGDAHDVATRLEQAIKNELGADVEVDTHIEPLQLTGQEGEDAPAETKLAIRQLIAGTAAASGDLREIHNVRVRQTGEGLLVNFHCRTDPGRSVHDVHVAVDELERRVRQARGDVRRIVGHAEPLKPA